MVQVMVCRETPSLSWNDFDWEAWRNMASSGGSEFTDQMETSSALLAFCEGNSLGTGEFPSR